MGARVGLMHVLIATVLGTGCAAPRLNSARQSFYRGNFDDAVVALQAAESDKKNRVLLRMERGMIQQARKNYKASVSDWSEAVEIAKALDVYSLSQGTVSLLSNDMAMSFRGAPYERTLLHAFSAKSYLALQMWEDAAVEARNMVHRLENLDGFPDDAYSHYLAGFCFEMIGDNEGAAFQYRLATKLLPDIRIDDKTGHIAWNRKQEKEAALKPDEQARTSGAARQSELVCFVVMGHAPAMNYSGIGLPPPRSAPYAEIYSGGKLLGRSYAFSNTRSLKAATERRLTAVKIVKEVSRIVIKDTAANMVSHENELLGELLRWFLFVLESPDRRHWATLPYWLQIARVSCPEDIKNYRIVFKTHTGGKIREETIGTPLVRRQNIFVSFCRDI